MAMNNNELLAIVSFIERERGVDREIVLVAIEQALQQAARRNPGVTNDLRVAIDRKTLSLHVYDTMVVSNEETGTGFISLARAQRLQPGIAEGETIEIEMPASKLGRIAAQTSRQMIMQKIREAERSNTFREFKGRIGEIVSGTVTAVNRRDLYVMVGKTEMLLPGKERIPTEEYGVGDLVRAIIVDSTVTCRMKRADVVDNANIRPGDVIVGLASFGQASYEDRYNGGMGSNGLTSARHDVFAKYLAEKYPESFDHAVPDELVYSGSYRLDDKVEGASVNAGQLVLSPTRTYAPVIKKILDLHRADIHGMVHCTGGAQTKVLHFVGDNCHVVKDNMFPVPPLFKTIQKESGTDWKEMYKVFNMGHRMEIYVAPEKAEAIMEISRSFNIDAQIVGHIEEGEKSLTIKSEFGTFEY